MSGVAKKVVMISVGLLIVFALLVAVIPQIQGSVTGLTTITDELVGVGDGATVDFDFTLDRKPVEKLTLVITDLVETFTDTLGTGTLTSDGAGSGTVVYATGVCDLTFAVAPTLGKQITADYGIEDVPTILVTLANLWWIPLILVMVGLIMGATKGGRRTLRRAFRRRRR